MDTSAGYVGTASTLQEIASSAARLLQESRPELHACELPESTQVPSTSTLARRDGPFGRGAEEKKQGDQQQISIPLTPYSTGPLTDRPLLIQPGPTRRLCRDTSPPEHRDAAGKP